MRVIAGSARSLPLKTIEGLETRPTTDRIKETLFNMLQTEISGCRFLDLYSGSGAIGIEALSRGAKEAYFVERSKECVECIKYNLKFTHLEDRAVVMEQDVLSALNRISQSEPFDIVFMDAPYRTGADREVLAALSASKLVDEYSTIIVEEALDTDFSYVEEISGLYIKKEKKYKTNKHVFIGVKR
jgi:16S rRNA (guanine966-N2)-methyltransferase